MMTRDKLRLIVALARMPEVHIINTNAQKVQGAPLKILIDTKLLHKF